MGSLLAVQVEGISKEYRLGARGPGYGRLTESLSAGVRGIFKTQRGERKAAEPTHLWALKDVSFDVPHGEVLGIIGKNGAGKSTLLKILARITAPSEGRAEVRGRVGSLLEVGTGFHPELTGRENIFLNGAILGMTRAEVRRRFDQIIDFSEVGDFIDTPVKRYSSGMYLRLAFSVAAHLEPEILVVDEVLAVGDIAFQRKCLGKMGDVAGSGRTVLFVSHNLAAVKSLCQRACMLEHGRLVADGAVDAVLSRYLQRSEQDGGEVAVGQRRDREGSGRMRFASLRLYDPDAAGGVVVCGGSARLELSYEAAQGLSNVHVSVSISTVLGEATGYLSNEMVGTPFPNIPASGTFVCDFERLQLLPGEYRINVHCTVGGVIADWVLDAATVTVAPGDFFGSGRLPPDGYGFVVLPQTWQVRATDDL
jgi:lipopolysaccharide transport system ATP-binding protein